MPNQNTITTTIDIKANIRDMEDGIQRIQKKLNGLALPQNARQSFEQTFGKLASELDKIKTRTADGKINPIDQKEIEKSFNLVEKMWSQLQGKMKSSTVTNAMSKKDAEAYEKMARAAKVFKEQIAAAKKIQTEQYKAAQRTEQAAKKEVNLAKEAKALAKQKLDAEKEYKTNVEKARKAYNDRLAREKEAGNTNVLKGSGKDTQLRANIAEAKALAQAEQEYAQHKKSLTAANNEYSASVTREKQAKVSAAQATNVLTEAEKENANTVNTAVLAAFNKLASTLKEAGIDLEKLGLNFDTLDYDSLRQKIDEFAEAQIRAAASGKDYSEEEEQVGRSLGEARKEIDQTGESLTELTDKQKEVTNLANRVKYFFSLSSGAMLFRRVLRQTVQTITELDKVMTQTAVVTQMTVGDMWKMLPQYTERANQLGVAIKDVYEADTLYYQQGLKTNEVMAVSNETMKMARIAGLDAAEATDRMTNALRGFNMEITTNNAQNINDVYSNLAAHTASNVQEISVAMTKVASLANSANMSFENTAAFLSQIIETTRESAETAGTALKTVIARFSEVKTLYSKGQLMGQDEEGQEIDVNKIGGALRTAGINLNEYITGAKGLDEIFMELSQKWDSLDMVQQRYIATMAAGSRQQSRFIALMQDYNRMTELTTMANNSAGASAEQFGKTLESLETLTNRLKNAWNEFLLGLLNTDLVKGIIKALTDLLNIVNKLTTGWDGFSTSFLKGFAAIGTFKIGGALFKSLSDQITNTFVKTGKSASEGFTTGLKGGFSKIKTMFNKEFWVKTAPPSDSFNTARESLEKLNKSYEREYKALLENRGISEEYKQLLDEQGISLDELTAMKKADLSIDQMAATVTDENAKEKLKATVASTALGEAEKNEAIKTQGVTAAKERENRGLIGNIAYKLGDWAVTKLQTAEEDSLIKKLLLKIPVMQGVAAGEIEVGTAGYYMLGIIGLIILAVVALIAVLVILIKAISKIAHDNSLEGRLERNAEAINKLSAAADEAKDNVSALEEALTKFEEFDNTFIDLVSGTQQWNDTLYESNQYILDLISRFPELAEKVDSINGHLTISRSSVTDLLNRQRELALTASTGLANAKSYQNFLQVQQSMQGVGRENQWIKGSDVGDFYTKNLVKSLIAPLIATPTLGPAAMIGGPASTVVEIANFEKTQSDVRYLLSEIRKGELSIDELRKDASVWNKEYKDYKSTFEKYETEFQNYNRDYHTYSEQQKALLQIIANNTANEFGEDQASKDLLAVLASTRNYAPQAATEYFNLSEDEKKQAYASSNNYTYSNGKLYDKESKEEVPWDAVKDAASQEWITDRSKKLLDGWVEGLSKEDWFKNASSTDKQALTRVLQRLGTADDKEIAKRYQDFLNEILNNTDYNKLESITLDSWEDFLPWNTFTWAAKAFDSTTSDFLTQAIEAHKAATSNAAKIIGNLTGTLEDESVLIGGVEVTSGQANRFLSNIKSTDATYGQVVSWLADSGLSEALKVAIISQDWTKEGFNLFDLLQMDTSIETVDQYQKAIDSLKELSDIIGVNLVNSSENSINSIRLWSKTLNDAISGEINKSEISKDLYSQLFSQLPSQIRSSLFQQTDEETYAFVGTQAEFEDLLRYQASLQSSELLRSAVEKGQKNEYLNTIAGGALTTGQLSYVLGRDENQEGQKAAEKAIKAQAYQYKELNHELENADENLDNVLTGLEEIESSTKFEQNLKVWDAFVKDLEELDRDSEAWEATLKDLAAETKIDIEWFRENYDAFVSAVQGDQEALKNLQMQFLISADVDLTNFKDGLLEVGEIGQEQARELLKSGMFDVVVDTQTVEAGIKYWTFDSAGNIVEEQKNYEQTIPTLKLKGKEASKLSAITEKAGTGAGKSGKAETHNWLTGLDKYYNLTAAINEQLRKREKMEREYDRLLERREGTYENLKQSLLDQQASLRREIDLQQQLQRGRAEQLAKAANEKIQWGEGYSTYAAVGATNYAHWDEQNHQVVINWDAIHAITNEDLGQAVEAYISKLEEYEKGWEDTESTIEDLDDKLYEINQRGKEQYLELEERVIDALVKQRQLEIDELQNISDEMNEMNSDIISNIQESIELERQIRDNTKKEEEISDLENRLEYLRRDTSGANQVAILETQEKLEEARQQYTDSLIDQTISQMQDDNEKAQEQREKQIDLMQKQLDWDEKHGFFNTKARELIEKAINENDGSLNNNSALVDLLKLSDNFAGLSEFNQMKFIDEMIKQYKEAMVGLGNWALDKAQQEGYIEASGNSAKTKLEYKDGKWVDSSGKVYNVEWNAIKQMFDAEAQNNEPVITTNSVDGKTPPGGTPPSKPIPKSYDLVDNSNNILGHFATEAEASKELTKQQNLLTKLQKLNSEYNSLTGNGRRIDWEAHHQDELRSYNIDSPGSIPTRIRSLQPYKEAKIIPRYLSGGLNTSTGPAWLDGTASKPEYVLNARDTQVYLTLTNLLNKLLSNTSSMSEAFSGGDNYFNIDINVDELGSDYDVDQLMERIKSQIVDDAMYRNVNVINLHR